MKHRSNSARLALSLFVGLVSTLVASTLGLAGCHAPLYYYPQYNFAGRIVPPSGLQQRVLATYTSANSGGAAILDGLRDIRFNIPNTITSFSIAGYSGSYPSTIISFPEQQAGYILDPGTGNLSGVDYSKENASAVKPNFGVNTPSAGAVPDGSRFVGATATSGQLIVTAGGTPIPLNLPNVNRVAINQGNSIILAMTRNSNQLYRVIQLPQNNVVPTPNPPGYVDCEPLLNPVYCVVPVPGNYDRPTGAYFSLDGSTVYVLNSGPEDGGTTASVSVLQSSALLVTNVPQSANYPSPLAALPVPNPVPIPGGVTVALSDGTTLYLAGQSRQADGLFAGNLTLVPLNTYVPSTPVSISDGTHTRLLFADNNTLWVGSSQCATGERAKLGQNYNCLTMVHLGAATPTATVIPSLIPGGTTTVPFPNTNGNLYYYGDLTGICWIQNYNKVYTAYGGQIHAFSTVDGTEINNSNVTVQGTVLDVAYMDALTNAAN